MFMTLEGIELHDVIPAKAGIQSIYNFWIPAFAGMTTFEVPSGDSENV
jgi:hypothetical protein